MRASIPFPLAVGAPVRTDNADHSNHQRPRRWALSWATCKRVAVAAVAAGAATMAAAQAQPPSAATDPQAPSATLAYQALPPLGALDSASTDWRAAHQAVAEFPRGHADLLRWEARQPQAASNATASTPSPGSRATPQPAMHHHHPGQQP
jgi:hypothetical protein